MTNLDKAPSIGGECRPVLNSGRRGAHHSLNDPYRDSPRRQALHRAFGKAMRRAESTAFTGFPLIWFVTSIATIAGAVHVALRYGAAL